MPRLLAPLFATFLIVGWLVRTEATTLAQEKKDPHDAEK